MAGREQSTLVLPSRPDIPPPAHSRCRYKYYKAFYWFDGGLAYNYTLHSLHHRLHALWGMVNINEKP
jgi:hypothetical protein